MVGRNVFLNILTLFVLMILFVTPVSAKTYALKGGTSVSDQVWQNVLAERWVSLINEKSEGRIKAENHCCAILGSDNAMGEKTMMGSLQWYYTSTSNLSRIAKEFSTYELPYLVENPEDSFKLFYVDGKLGGPLTERIQKDLAKKNLRLMWISSVWFRAVMNSKHEIRVPEDTKGLKLRVTASDLERESVASWGGSPVPMGYAEVYTSLQQGTIDGLSVALPEAYPMKFYEVIKYATENRFNSYSAVYLMNLDTWNSLPKDLQRIVADCSDAMAKYEAENKMALYDNIYLKELEKKGMVVYTPTAAEMELWKKTTIETVWPKAIGSLIKQEWVDDWKKLLGKQ